MRALARHARALRSTVAVGLAQIGEFSFILGALGVSLGVLPAEGMDALVIAAIVSIAVNPLLFRLLARMERSKPAPARAAERSRLTGVGRKHPASPA